MQSFAGQIIEIRKSWNYFEPNLFVTISLAAGKPWTRLGIENRSVIGVIGIRGVEDRILDRSSKNSKVSMRHRLWTISCTLYLFIHWVQMPVYINQPGETNCSLGGFLWAPEYVHGTSGKQFKKLKSDSCLALPRIVEISEYYIQSCVKILDLGSDVHASWMKILVRI